MISHKAAILGASGYAGAELLRYLSAHPSIEVAWVTAESNAGNAVGDLYGHLPRFSDLRFEPTDVAAVPDVDVAFLALPHGSAATHGKALADRGIAVVDFSADWRLHDASAYDAWYGAPHPHPEQLSTWTYGLTELHRSEIAGSKRVANPGCYPSAAILALAPLLAEKAIASDGIVIDAASGVSGAGRKADAAYGFSELDSSYKAYAVGTHRHTPEIEQELSLAASTDVAVTFTPHLAPMARGLLATCYAKLQTSAAQARAVLDSAYKAEPFVHVLGEGAQPATKHVSGTNNALIGVGCDERTQTLVVTCAIDNMGKGAAGQAVQNANLMLGLDETTGLGSIGLFP
jgi:N-acetyl-gamma-glutamyl-phosphate reductase